MSLLGSRLNNLFLFFMKGIFMKVYLVMSVYHKCSNEDQIVVVGIYNSKDKAGSAKQRFLESKYFRSSERDYDYISLYIKDYVLDDWALEKYSFNILHELEHLQSE